MSTVASKHLKVAYSHLRSRCVTLSFGSLLEPSLALEPVVPLNTETLWVDLSPVTSTLTTRQLRLASAHR